MFTYCTECGRSLARANARRATAGLPRLPFTAKTCSPACQRARQQRLARVRWDRIKHRKLVAVRPVPEPWRCAECGIDAGAADVKRRRLGLPPIRPRNVVCSPRCQVARDARRYIIRHGHPPRTRRRIADRKRS